MKIVTVIGARPQFIKAAVVSSELRKKHKEITIHTGQHYDKNMSDVFFEEMHIPKPDYNLNINGKSHGRMTGEMIIALEEVFIEEKPDMTLLYGDTNSTLAGALTSIKLHVPITHVEAGNRLFTFHNPEEINRILTDRVSSLLLCAVESSIVNLHKEGRDEGVYFVGDPMYDAFTYYSGKCNLHNSLFKSLIDGHIKIPNDYYYLTCHREENTDKKSIIEILDAMQELDSKVVFPVHPRVKSIVCEVYADNLYDNIIFIQPVGYLESIALINSAKKVITDSGGVQREAFFAEVQCVTIFDYISWPETMNGNRNQLAKPNKQDILRKLEVNQEVDRSYQPFGDGKSSIKIVQIINEYFNNR